MSESLRKLKEIPVVNKIMLDIERALGVKDKVSFTSWQIRCLSS